MVGQRSMGGLYLRGLDAFETWPRWQCSWVYLAERVGLKRANDVAIFEVTDSFSSLAVDVD
jgi:hypothetical protein